MNASAKKGNNPELWDKLINDLDEKLQLGLLDRLNRISAYHFENDILYIEPGNEDDLKYLTKPSVTQQLKLLAEEITGVKEVKIRGLDTK